MQIEAVVIAVFLIFYYLIGAGIRALYRLLTGAAAREQEEEQRRLAEQRREERERQRREELRLRVIENAKRRFEEAVMVGRFPSDDVLAILEDCHSEISVNTKEATEELLVGRGSMCEMDWSDAVGRIRQHQRTQARAKARAARGVGFEASGTVSQGEAYELLGVSPGCTTAELAAAYRRTISQWHPDKLDSMADELKAFATRRTARINEAYQRLKQGAQACKQPV